MLKRKPTFQAPFVTTFAAAATTAIVVACGGHVDTSSGFGPDPDGGCPETQPKEGDPCSAGSQICDFPGTGSCGGGFECVDGKWHGIVGSCNPPAPPPTCGGLLACPATAPQAGTSCGPCPSSYPAQCSYGDCYGTPTNIAQCDPRTGLWSYMGSSCNPPATFDAGVPDAAVGDAAKNDQ